MLEQLKAQNAVQLSDEIKILNKELCIKNFITLISIVRQKYIKELKF